MIVVSYIKKAWKDKGKRMPKGYMESLERFVTELVATTVENGGEVIKAAEVVPPKHPITGAMVQEAIRRRKEGGRLDKPGLLIEAKECAEDHRDAPEN